MNNLFAAIHIQDKLSEILPLQVDFERNVEDLKRVIAEKLQYDAEKLELIYNGHVLEDAQQLNGLVRPNATIHCFQKTKKYTPYEPNPEKTSAKDAILQAREEFTIIAHTQISVNSRVNILQKILAEYPEFRRNLGAQALIRDSVLFNTFHQSDVIKRIAETYPIIIEAAPFICDTIKKELARSNSAVSEAATDSTNSSEEENSLGAHGSTDRAGGSSEAAGSDANVNIRQITSQQLRDALARIGTGSANSLTNIAQRNSDETPSSGSASTPVSLSASQERLRAAFLRNNLTRALDAALPRDAQRFGSTQPPPTENAAPLLSDDSDGVLPPQYRNHQYAEQLCTMAQMGFINYEENLTYLNLANGNIENAINLLMGAMY